MNRTGGADRDDMSGRAKAPAAGCSDVLRPPVLLAKLSAAAVARDALAAGVQLAQRVGATADVSIGASFSVILSSGQLMLCRYGGGGGGAPTGPAAAVGPRSTSIHYLLSNVAAFHLSSRGQLVAATRDGLFCGCVLHDDNYMNVGTEHFYPIDCDPALSDCLWGMCDQGGCDCLSIEQLGDSDTYVVYNRKELVLIEGLTPAGEEAHEGSVEGKNNTNNVEVEDDRIMYFRPATPSAVGFPDVAEALCAVPWVVTFAPSATSSHGTGGDTSGEGGAKAAGDNNGTPTEVPTMMRVLVLLSGIGETFFLPMTTSPEDGLYRLMATGESSRRAPNRSAEGGDNENGTNEAADSNDIVDDNGAEAMGDFGDFQKGLDYWTSAISPGLEPNLRLSSGASIIGASGTCDGSIILWGFSKRPVMPSAQGGLDVRRVCDGIQEQVFASKVLPSTVMSLSVMSQGEDGETAAPEVTILSLWAADASGQLTELYLESGFEQQLLVRRRLHLSPSASISTIALVPDWISDASRAENSRLLCFCSDEMSLYEFCLFDCLIGFASVIQDASDSNTRNNRSLVSCCSLIPGTMLLSCGSSQPMDPVVVWDMRDATKVLSLPLAPSVPNYAGSTGGKCTAIASFCKFESLGIDQKSRSIYLPEESLQYSALIVIGQSQGQLIIYEVATTDICRSFFGHPLKDAEQRQQLLAEEEEARAALSSAPNSAPNDSHKKRSNNVSSSSSNRSANSRPGVGSRGTSGGKEQRNEAGLERSASEPNGVVNRPGGKISDGVASGRKFGANAVLPGASNRKEASSVGKSDGTAERPGGVRGRRATDIRSKPGSAPHGDAAMKNIVVDRLSALDIIEEAGGESSSGIRISASDAAAAALQPVKAGGADAASFHDPSAQGSLDHTSFTESAQNAGSSQSMRLVLRSRLSLDVHCRLPITDIFLSNNCYFAAICFARKVIVVQSLLSGKALRQFDLSSPLTHISASGAHAEQRFESTTTTASTRSQQESQDSLILTLQLQTEIKILDCIRGIFLPFNHMPLFSSTAGLKSVPVAAHLWKEEGGDIDAVFQGRQESSFGGLFVMKQGGVAYANPDKNFLRTLIEAKPGDSTLRDPVMSLYAKEFPVESPTQFLAGVAWMHSVVVTKILRSEISFDAQSAGGEDDVGSHRLTAGSAARFFQVPPELRCSVVCLAALPQEPRSRTSRVLLVLADGSVFLARV